MLPAKEPFLKHLYRAHERKCDHFSIILIDINMQIFMIEITIGENMICYQFQLKHRKRSYTDKQIHDEKYIITNRNRTDKVNKMLFFI